MNSCLPAIIFFMSLLAAVQSGVFDDVKRLLDSKGNPNERDVQKQTPLHIAAQKGDKDIMAYLLKSRKVDVNAQDEQGWTALLVSVVHGNYSVIQCLLNHKAIKAAAPNAEFNTPFIYLCKKRNIPDSEVKLYTDTLYMFQKLGVDLNERNMFGETALHYAAMCNNLPAIKFLHENNANFNAINKCVLCNLLTVYTNHKITSRGETPLQYAMSAPEYQTISNLLKYGADPTIKPHDGVELHKLTEDPQIKNILERKFFHMSLIPLYNN